MTRALVLGGGGPVGIAWESGLIAGLAFAIVLVYLLIVVNFQSWLDPFIIITALPAALAGPASSPTAARRCRIARCAR